MVDLGIKRRRPPRPALPMELARHWRHGTLVVRGFCTSYAVQNPTHHPSQSDGPLTPIVVISFSGEGRLFFALAHPKAPEEAGEEIPQRLRLGCPVQTSYGERGR